MENIAKYKFTKIKLTKSERIWLKKIYSYDFHIFDDKSTKMDLADSLGKGFDHRKIDYRVLREGRLTLIGLWHVDYNNKYIDIVTGIIFFLKAFLKTYDFGFRLGIKNIIGKVQYGEREISIAFMLMNDLGFFQGGSLLRHSGMDHMKISNENGGLDRIIYFKNIYEVMEENFIKYPPLKTSPIPSKGKFQMNKNSSEEDIWESIKDDYSVSKNIFGKKINFIRDVNVRKIIFRDVEHAYSLIKMNIHKPSIILIGSVMEEILRQVLLSKKLVPTRDNFDEYIKACREHELLSISVKDLTNSARIFRNNVHISKEISNSNEVSQAAANSAFSSLFVLVDGLKP